ncbi:MAG: HupE/UreJ family protein [Nitrosomonadales bacterium]|nr:HupE/UreJ family protein [Nitrosomonadales bacterium]
MKNYFARPILAVSCFFLPFTAQAHVGTGPTNGFVVGLAHPIGGPDHLLAMVAIGIWAAQMGQRSIWAVPLAFVSDMALGGMLGVSGIPIPFGESGIAVSVLALGILIIAAAKLPLAASVVIVGLFAVFHGYAHGAEMPLGASGTAYGLGFILSTVSLYLCGIGFGILMQRISMPWVVRAAGAPIALFGGYLCLAG